MTATVPSDRQVHIVLPNDVPIGPVEIQIRVTSVEEKLPTLGDLLDSEFFGMWSDRTDIQDSVEFARELRKKAWSRGEGITE